MDFKFSLLKLLILPKSATLIVITAVFLQSFNAQGQSCGASNSLHQSPPTPYSLFLLHQSPPTPNK